MLFVLLIVGFLGSVRCRTEFEAGDSGYYLREHSLVQPYQGAGVDMPFWDFGGSTVVTSSYVRLTPDRQSKQGSLWNNVPVRMHNWEVLLHFQVHGQAKHLYGDGFAFWYTKERAKDGTVFGNQNYFTGLGVFFDTYSNHNGPHAHNHPYISAMVNNGSLAYDHDRDGTHSQVAGCSAHFRSSKYESYVMISYINRQLVVMVNVEGETEWKPCFTVNDVDLPTGYFYGATATTGDLADNHDVIFVKVYDIEAEYKGESTQGEEMDWSTVVPQAANQEQPRPRVEDSLPVISSGTYNFIGILLVGALIVGVVAVVIGFIYMKDNRKKGHFF